MKTAIITDSSAVIDEKYKNNQDLYILEIPIVIDGETYYEDRNITSDEFYKKMAASPELPKTSQPSIAELENLLADLESRGYTHVIGLFLSKGISGFYQNSYYLQEEFPNLTIKFFDTLITSVPLGYMSEVALNGIAKNQPFDLICEKIELVIDKTRAFIIVDDLNHLVKGGRLTNGAAIIGNLLSIKPILEFDRNGQIVVCEKVRSQKKAFKHLYKHLKDSIDPEYDYRIAVIHANELETANEVAEKVKKLKVGEVQVTHFGAIIGTHLGEGAVALGILPLVD